jgi:hypothetical protein
MKKITIYIRYYFYKFFTVKICLKILTIFSIGFYSRWFINYACNINVFQDYTHYISFIFYGFFAVFVVFINEVFDDFALKFASVDLNLLRYNYLIYKIKNLFYGVNRDSHKIYIGDNTDAKPKFKVWSKIKTCLFMDGGGDGQRGGGGSNPRQGNYSNWVIGASTATPAELESKRLELKRWIDELETKKIARTKLNDLHSRMGDVDHPDEGKTGEALESIDSRISYLKQNIDKTSAWMKR